jgi:ribosomal protein S21
MALEIRKQERETSQNLIRRFTKRVQKSGILLQARKIMFKRRQKSDEAKKRAALRREELKKHYQKLKKLEEIE